MNKKKKNRWYFMVMIHFLKWHCKRNQDILRVDDKIYKRYGIENQVSTYKCSMTKYVYIFIAVVWS